MQKYRIKSYYIFQLDLALKDENGGDISSFISNGEWDLIGNVYIIKKISFNEKRYLCFYFRNNDKIKKLISYINNKP